MKLVIFGATGPTGRELVRQALAAGHDVTAVARRPEALQPADPRLRLVSGDVQMRVPLSAAVAGADAVLSALGIVGGNKRTTVYSVGTAAIVKAMRETGVRRFVGVSAAPVAPVAQSRVLRRYALYPLLYRFFGDRWGWNDMRRMEDVLTASDRDWTVFRPPRLTNKPATGHPRTTVDGPLARAWSVPRADLAAAMLSAVGDASLVGHAVTIAA